MICPNCGCPSPRTVVMESGPHHAKLVCGNPDCDRFFKWLPRPRVPWRELELPTGDPKNLPRLFGSPKQIEYAESFRRPMLRAIWKVGPEYQALAVAASTIPDASWWIVSRGKHPDEMAWPGHWAARKPVKS